MTIVTVAPIREFAGDDTVELRIGLVRLHVSPSELEKIHRYSGEHLAKLNSDCEPQAYLEDLVEVGKRHGFTLGHEDGHGGFLVESPSEHNEKWLRAAVVHEPTRILLQPPLAAGFVQAESMEMPWDEPPKIETNETPPMHPSPVECKTCKGTGNMLKTIERGAHQGNVIRSDCPECKGKGHP